MTNTLRTRRLNPQAGHRSEFVIGSASEPLGSVKTGLATAATQAGLGQVHPHMLRHRAAVRMAVNGVDMEEIRSELGPSDSKTSRNIHARFSPDRLREAAASLELDEGPIEVRRRA
ncbi:tyrosine-type recombinase/integrase [Methylobacterium planeticum]|nr:tyrosine-type recombinase/integrase [Methylobacterium planeticum]